MKPNKEKLYTHQMFHSFHKGNVFLLILPTCLFIKKF